MDERYGAGLLTPYVVKSLPEKERLVTLARFPKLLRLLSWLALIVIGVGFLGLFFFRLVTGSPEGPELILWLLISVVGISIFVFSQIHMHTTEFGLTDQRIIFKRGVVARFTDEIPLHALESVHLHQGILGRLFNFGRLEVNGSGGSGLWTPFVQNPVNLRSAIADARSAKENPVRYEAHRPQHSPTE